MNKLDIINEIKRTAALNDGKPLGQDRFTKETGISIGAWCGKYWIRWSDVLREAGFEPNQFQVAYDNNLLLEKLAYLTRELNHFPVKAEMQIKAHVDKSFPSDTTFDRLGKKSERILKLFDFCKINKSFEDVLQFLPETKVTQRKDSESETINQAKGFVYLVQHGNRREYKIGRTNNPIRREGEISLELPEKASPIHWIETDDPSGIENYWHLRFAKKRKNGEWFDLNAEDIRAFKRWKKIF